MSQQTWEEALISRPADGTQISNTTTETIMIPDFAFPANYFYAGRSVRVKLWGVISNVVTTPGTITFRVRWGGVSGTILVATSALTQDTTARTNAPFQLEVLITCRTAGSSGSLATSMTIIRTNQAGGAGAGTTTQLSLWPDLGTSPVVSALDLASSQALSVTAQFSVSTSPTNLTVQQSILESLN